MNKQQEKLLVEKVIRPMVKKVLKEARDSWSGSKINPMHWMNWKK